VYPRVTKDIEIKILVPANNEPGWSQTQGKTTQSVNFSLPIASRISSKTDFFTRTGEMIVTASKRYFSIVVPQLDGRVFPTFVQGMWLNVNAFRKDRKCFKIVQTNGLSVKENTNASECTTQSNSIFAFAFDNLSSPSSFSDLWINFSSLVNV